MSAMVAKKTRTRRSAEETRALMLEAGLEQLEREGVHYGLEHITLEAAWRVADVPRSSSHSAWAIEDEHMPQVTYQRAVLQRWLSDREGLMFATAAEQALTEAFEEHGDRLTKGEIVRVAIQAAIEAAVEPDGEGRGSGFLSTDMALKHAVASQPASGRDPDVAGWVRDTEVSQREKRIEDTYKPLGALLGIRPRPEFGEAAYEHLALAVAALVEGIAMRHHVIPDRAYATAPIRDDGSSVVATLLGVCVEALVDTFFEDGDPSA